MRTWTRAIAAFTLVEVTIVAGIIAGARGSYTGAMDRARRMACQHNLQQLYQGLYQLDLFDGRLPEISFFSKDPQKDPKSLLRVLGPEFSGVLLCPTMPEDIKKHKVTYIFNDELSGKSLDSVRDRRKTWVLMGMTATVRDPKDKRRLAGPQPHSGGVNVLYADGHVEWTKTPPVLKPIDAPKEDTEESTESPASPSEPRQPSRPPGRIPRIPTIPRGY